MLTQLDSTMFNLGNLWGVLSGSQRVCLEDVSLGSALLGGNLVGLEGGKGG